MKIPQGVWGQKRAGDVNSFILSAETPTFEKINYFYSIEMCTRNIKFHNF